GLDRRSAGRSPGRRDRRNGACRVRPRRCGRPHRVRGHACARAAAARRRRCRSVAGSERGRDGHGGRVRLRRPSDQPGPWAFFADFPRILPYLRPHKMLAFSSLALVGGGALTALLAPWPLALMIDTVLGNKPLPALLGFLDGLSRYQLLAITVTAG